MKQHSLFWGSSYDRGLDNLLFIWSDIKKEFPDAELHVCYGWELFDKMTVNNPERQEWKKRVVGLMAQDGVVHHGRVGKAKLEKIRKSCGIWAYPTYFTEINCITGLSCQADGVVPVTMALGALDETVQSGIKIDGDIKDPKVMEEYKKALIKMMGNKQLWESERKKGIEFSKNYTWDNIAKQWDKVFKQPVKQPLVSIYTPTIRKGWWNIMANNIASQSYKNIEWIIVDDFPTNRKYIAEKYAKKYNLDIKYLRGNKGDYHFGLSTANNIAWKQAKGEIIVFLQDFVLMPSLGIEQVVDIYNHNPDCIIAPCDMAFSPKIKPDTDSEDWFNGRLDVVGEFLRKNQRITKQGLRYSTNHYELELNYGAIPLHILKDLNGFWEFFNDGLGFDDTEILYRAFKAGYKLIVDDTNVAICLDHWEPLKDKQSELGEKRIYRLNDPRFVYLVKKMKGGWSYRRDESKDKRLEYEIPESSKEEAVVWMRKNMDKIISKWL